MISRVHPSVEAAHQGALWIDQMGPITRRPAVTGDVDVDIAIVGGGFSGLWTAYYLAKADPTLRILLLEKHYCGFGASGRNGGWAVGDLAGSFESYAKVSSASEALRQARAVFEAVDEIGRVAEAESIECDYAKGGWIRLARTTPQAKRQRDEIAHERSNGFTEDEIRLLEPDEARRYLDGTGVRGGIYFAATAALHPARLARGLADVVERMGVTIAESTTVEGIEQAPAGPVVRTNVGSVKADVVVRATEAYTRDLAGERRTLLPIYSLMVATEPLPQSVFDDIGLADRPTFSDDRFMVIYGQRTADDRLAFGGRGVPYRFGSKIDRATELHLPSHNLLRDTLTEMLPAIGDVQITHRWGGVLG
ncbi:MAG: FAD-dependent oxidoreductase, partial [Acidimicrobiales bacterium]|nr:FAD-dependent oxidoreductase [Acidimicrobiales bacterium]